MPAPILKFKRGNLVDLPALQAGEPGFTVDKFDLFVGVNSTSNGNKIVGSARYWTRETTTAGSGVNLVEGTDNGTSAITIKAPASLAGDQTYIFPGSPTSGGFLRSDGSGNLTWDTGSGFNGGSFPLSALDIDGGTDIGAAIVDADEFIVDDGGGGTNRKVDASRIKDYVLGGGQGANFSAINVSGITTATFLKSTTAVIGAGLTVTGALDVDSTSNFANTVTIASGGANVTGTVSATQFTGSGAGLSGGTTPISTLDIDGGTDIGTALVDADEFIVDDGGNGTNRKVDASRIKDYVLGGGQGANFAAIKVSGIGTVAFVDSTQLKVSGISTFTGQTNHSTINASGTVTANQFTGSGAGLSAGTTPLSTLDIDGGTDVGADLVDADLIIVDDGAGGTNRKSAMSRVKSYVLGGGSGATFAAINVTGISTQAFVDATQLKVSGISTFTGQTNHSTINASSTITGTAFHTGAEGSAIRVTSNTISGPATITLDPAGVGDNTGKVVIAGDFQVDGTTTTVNSTTMTVDDKNLELGTGAANDAAANGGGLTIVSGEGNKTFNFEATGDNLGSSENLNIASGKVYKVNNVETLSATTLGANVVNSSLTNVGTLTGLSVSGTASVTGQITAGDLRNSSDGLIPLVGVQTASGHTGLVTAFKFRGSGLDNFIVSNGVADVILTGVAATTFTSRQTHTATQGQTTFTVSAGYQEGFIDVYQNGVRLINGTDYAAENGSTFVMTEGATVGDEFESVAWKGLGNINSLQNLDIVDNLTVTGVTTTGRVDGDLNGTGIDVSGIGTVAFLKSTTATVGAGLTVTGALDVDGVADFAQNVTIEGNLTVNGTTTQMNTVNMSIEDTLLELQKVDGGALSSDTNKDVGLILNYYSGSAKKSAFYWDDSAARFVVAGEASETNGVMTPSAYGGLEIGSLYVNDCAGQSQVISCSGTTRSLENITVDGGSF